MKFHGSYRKEWIESKQTRAVVVFPLDCPFHYFKKSTFENSENMTVRTAILYPASVSMTS